MDTNHDLKELERQAYLGSYSDGTIDVFMGVSVAWIGAAWIWLPDLAGFAGVFPAVFVTAMVGARQRLLQSRLGYVKWSEPRRRWERRNLYGLLGSGVAILLIGVALFVLVSDRSTPVVRDWSELVAALPAALLGLIAVGVGLTMGIERFLAYGALLGIAAAATAVRELGPGWPLLISGVGIAATGFVMLIRFLQRHPSVASV